MTTFCILRAARLIRKKDIGIEIRFSKHRTYSRKFEELLTKHGLTPKEEYETADGEPEPEETRINL